MYRLYRIVRGIETVQTSELTHYPQHFGRFWTNDEAWDAMHTRMTETLMKRDREGAYYEFRCVDNGAR